MNLIKCYMNNSTWLKQEHGTISVKGVLWHSTGANNTNIKRYVQPDDNATDRNELINKIGKNQYSNDWNHIEREAGVSFWIGKIADGSIATVQAGPDNIRQWGCGGSLNNTHIQFEICEDGLDDKSYFEKIYKEAVELTAYLCKKYNLNPLGAFTYNGKTVPVITDHAGSHKLGMGSNHGDVGHWFRKHLGNDYLNQIRNDVAKLLEVEKPAINHIPSEINVGDLCKITGKTYYGGSPSIPEWVLKQNWYVKKITGDRVVIDENEAKTNSINSPINIQDLEKVVKGQPTPQKPVEQPKPQPEQQLKSNEEIAREVILGKWGNGTDRKNRLTEAGYNYSEIQDIVNKIMSGSTTVQKPVSYELKVGDAVKLQNGANVYGRSIKFASWVYDSTLYVREISGSRVVISTLKTGSITGAVDKKYLTKI